MVRRKRSRRSFRRRYTRRRTPRKTSRIARKALRIARRLASNIEVKHIDNTHNNVLIGKNIVDTRYEPFQMITVGANDNAQRIGDRISANTLYHKFTFHISNNGTVGENPPQWTTVRYYVAMIPRPTDPSDAGVDLIRFFENNNVDRVAPLGWKQWDYKNTFRLLYSKVYTIDTFHPTKTFYHRIPLKKKVQYVENTNNVLKWMLVFGFIGSWAATEVGISNCRVSHTYRVTYTDT